MSGCCYARWCCDCCDSTAGSCQEIPSEGFSGQYGALRRVATRGSRGRGGVSRDPAPPRPAGIRRLGPSRVCHRGAVRPGPLQRSRRAGGEGARLRGRLDLRPRSVLAPRGDRLLLLGAYTGGSPPAANPSPRKSASAGMAPRRRGCRQSRRRRRACSPTAGARRSAVLSHSWRWPAWRGWSKARSDWTGTAGKVLRHSGGLAGEAVGVPLHAALGGWGAGIVRRR